LAVSYFADAEYIDYFYDGLSPWMLDYLAAIHGFPRTELAEGFDYLELGCGTGLSLTVHAAANPMGRFFGVDFNPEHIRRATRTAEQGQVNNLTFLEEDFAHLLERDLPRFDMIVLHGVYSWISQAMRRELQGFIAHRLKPAGKVYISYNALPGWASQAPIRHFMATWVENHDGPTLDKVAKGLEYLRRLQEVNAPSVTGSPQVKALVEHILEADPRYVAHEYFTQFWEPFYFRQVADDMGRVGLNYLGCLPVPLNYGAFCLPEKLQGLFDGLGTRLEFETHKDFVLNTVFRRDVYCLGRNGHPTSPGNRLDRVTLGSFRCREDFQFKFEVKGNTVDLDGAIFPKLADLLAGTRMPAARVLEHPSLANFAAEEIREGLECLVASGQVLPMAPGPMPAAEGLSPLNRHLLERDIASATHVALACPGSGTGVQLAPSDALILLGLAEVGLDRLAPWTHEWAARNKLNLSLGDGSAALEDHLRGRVRRLPLAALGLEDPFR